MRVLCHGSPAFPNIAQHYRQRREKAAAEFGLDLILAIEDDIVVLDQCKWRDKLAGQDTGRHNLGFIKSTFSGNKKRVELRLDFPEHGVDCEIAILPQLADQRWCRQWSVVIYFLETLETWDRLGMKA